MSVQLNHLLTKHGATLEAIKTQEWMPHNNTRLKWDAVKSEFARMCELKGETATLQAIAQVEFSKSSWSPSDVWAVLNEQQAVRESNPQVYEDLRKNAADPTQGWILKFRQEAMLPYLSGRINVQEYERRCREIVPDYDKVEQERITERKHGVKDGGER